MSFDRHQQVVEQRKLPGETANYASITYDGSRSCEGKPPVFLLRRASPGVIVTPSLAELFHANSDMILRYFRAHGAVDHADDLLQELWLKVERAPLIAEVSRAYLMKMAHNLVVDEARAATRRRARDHTWQGEGAGFLDVDPTPDAEQVVIFRDGLRRIEEVLRRLGPKTERIVRRHRIDGIPQKQLATEEGLSLSSVEKHLQKAYRAIALVQIELDGTGRQMR